MALESRKKLRLGDILISHNVVTVEQLDEALKRQKQSGDKLGEVLVRSHMCTEDAIAHALSDQLKIPTVELAGRAIDEAVLNLIPSSMAKKYCAIPYSFSKENANVLYVAMSDPMDMMALDDFSIVTNYQIEPRVATPSRIYAAIDRAYGAQDAMEVASKYERERSELYGDEQDSRITEESAEVSNAPIVQLVRTMIESAIRQRASDIHIEPMIEQIRVRYRIDGALYERMVYSTKLLAAIVARVKVLGGMDISEKRKPQDGRITQVVDRQEYDIRVSTIPTVYGEKVVMRLASKNALMRSKSQLGLSEEETKVFDEIFRHPHGIVLVTGPTGSGKSTTLYTALSELNKEDVNIITVEDPVEANIDGINQIQVNPKAELTFANALRSILRQDPDIIMIGEIRDTETAEIAVQASITGHLVVSTLHTNSTAISVGRLVDMGVQPYLLSDALAGIIAQRLVRRLCPVCRRARQPDEFERNLLCIGDDGEVQIYEPCGCPQCDNTGYRGRIGVYEMMKISPAIRRAVSVHATTEEIRDLALKEGLQTLRMGATRYVLDGITSLSEMMKVSFDI
ncbi:MAG: Flp pilus assembly complex ATPase component TadA [Lachnospiraceae bacterium]|nr:Flp pilus assembly complex ATPase component TadA [Lachnospiraceae bacterium]